MDSTTTCSILMFLFFSVRIEQRGKGKEFLRDLMYYNCHCLFLLWDISLYWSLLEASSYFRFFFFLLSHSSILFYSPSIPDIPLFAVLYVAKLPLALFVSSFSLFFFPLFPLAFFLPRREH